MSPTAMLCNETYACIWLHISHERYSRLARHHATIAADNIPKINILFVRSARLQFINKSVNFLQKPLLL